MVKTKMSVLIDSMITNTPIKNIAQNHFLASLSVKTKYVYRENKGKMYINII